MHPRLAKFVDPTSPVFAVSSAAAFAALSLVDPARLSPARRRAYRVGLATTTGLWAGVTTDRDRSVFVPAHVVAGLFSGGAVLALAGASDALDEQVMTRLQAAGVRRPRPWLAALSAASVLASSATDHRAAARTKDTERQMWVEEPMRTRPLPQPVREVVGAILHATDTADAHVLLEQLAVAQEAYFDDENGDFLTTVEFEVPDEVTRVVPHFQIYPVHARFRAPEGTELQVSLQLIRGKLANVAIEAADEDHIEPVDEILTQWPQVADLRYVREATDGHFLPLP